MSISLISGPFPPAAPPVGSAYQQRLETTERLLSRAASARTARERRGLQQDAVLLNLPLADAMSYRYAGRGVEWDDLCQVGRFALVKAVRGYRPGTGASFTAYAVPTITGEIKRHFRDCGWVVRPPRRLQELRLEIGPAESTLQQRLRRPPTVPELAEALGVTEGDLAEALLAGGGFTPLSLDAPRSAGGDVPLADLLVDDRDPYGTDEWSELLRRGIGRLSQQERTILWLRFVDELTQAQIGARIGVSQMQISRLLACILGRLRDELTGSEVRAVG